MRNSGEHDSGGDVRMSELRLGPTEVKKTLRMVLYI